ncbi:succinate receptor 1-like [Hemibagrus wyckioides]|uniref:succinate receptor 1-like n=1 Tax=Hemibagrus wyckioides TaxID=337641 RepID=UPI00266D538E|nr:succinate receptor 1-like [Hemibagrus wyckioides]
MFSEMDSNHTVAYYETLACNLTAPGQGAMQIVQLFLMPWIFLAVLVLGVPLNVISLWVLSRRVVRSNRSTLFLHNLALADISWLMALPFLIQFHLSGMEWSLGVFFCKLIRMLYHNYFYLSIFFVTCVSVDRYLAIVHPVHSPVLLTRQRAIMLCVTVWVFAIVMSIPVAQLTYISNCQSDNKTVCSMYIFMSTVNQSLSYSLCCTCVGFLLPFSVLSYCYMRSVCQLRRRVDPRLRGLACELGAVMVLFGLFYLPYHVSRNVAIAMPSLAPDNPSAWEVADLVFCLEMCVCSFTSCTNPLFSCFLGRTLRRELWSTLTKLWKKHRVEPEHKEDGRAEESPITINKAAN